MDTESWNWIKIGSDEVSLVKEMTELEMLEQEGALGVGEFFTR